MKELRRIAEDFHLTMSEEELASYATLAVATLDGYTRLPPYACCHRNHPEPSRTAPGDHRGYVE